MKLSIKDFFRKCDQICNKLENFIFCVVVYSQFRCVSPTYAIIYLPMKKRVYNKIT